MAYTPAYNFSVPAYRTIRYDEEVNLNMYRIEAALNGFPGSTPPGSAGNWPDVTPSTGMRWFDTVNNQVKIYYNGLWQMTSIVPWMLSSDNCEHSQECDKPVCVWWFKTLLPNDCEHSQECDKPNIIPIFKLVPFDCEHSQECDKPVWIWDVSPDNCEHSQECDKPNFTVV